MSQVLFFIVVLFVSSGFNNVFLYFRRYSLTFPKLRTTPTVEKDNLGSDKYKTWRIQQFHCTCPLFLSPVFYLKPLHHPWKTNLITSCCNKPCYA
ncbi:predicted protein [Arabidopsis lyrata subsp. lyrata]|uniref:Predicted protein n=1 Tax=Arabidopsis lyrata subsp. lyrata TaxID=81972 RepID=D7LVK6_ARALL|nr:predicted protein [Arabidopsis lyrata subsp. lyrata]